MNLNIEPAPKKNSTDSQDLKTSSIESNPLKQGGKTGREQKRERTIDKKGNNENRPHGGILTTLFPLHLFHSGAG